MKERLARAASVVPTGRAGKPTDGDMLFGDVRTRLDLADAKRYTNAIRSSLAESGRASALVTGQPAIQHDLDGVFAVDLRRGEVIAVAVALVTLLVIFGFSPAVLVPFLVAACTISATLIAVYVAAHAFDMVTYVTNLVVLIGFALAVDYSLLLVFRFREEVARGGPVDDAVVRTMATAGRSIIVSGLAVALGLSLLLFIPVPLIRSLGVGGLLVPFASIFAAVTLQPALLSLLGERGVRRRPDRERSRGDVEDGGWARLARTIMRRPVVFLIVGTAVLLAAAAPALALELTPGSISTIPGSPESVRAYELLRRSIGAGAITPVHIVVDAGGAREARTPAVQGAVDRLTDAIFHEPEAKVVATGKTEPYVSRDGRYVRIVVAGRHEFGSTESRDFVERLRSDLVPAARFPAGTAVWVGGAPAQGVDFLDRAYAVFPWIALCLLAVTYLVLLRAFRSLLLPLKAVLLNLLSVAAACGLLVLVFRWDVGGAFGLRHADAIEGWIPIFLFAALFGISMDYEVFLVSRMREAWDAVPDNTRAVAHGLQRTGPVVTAAAVIMVAAFAGFAAGRVTGLQQFGVGLMFAVLIDATIVRAVLLPSAMAIMGRYNWWLPATIARGVRVEPSPLMRSTLREGCGGTPPSDFGRLT